MHKLIALMRVFAAAMGLTLFVPIASVRAETATPDDTARLLAGLAPGASSPLSSFAQDAGWQRHAKHFDTAWKGLEDRQLSRIGAWSRKNIARPSSTVFYMFSGPDYLYADAFFP